MKNLIRVSMSLVAFFYGLSFAAAGVTCTADDRNVVTVSYAPPKKLNCMNVWLADFESYALTCNVTFDGKFYRGKGKKFGRAFRASVNIETGKTDIQGKTFDASCAPL